MSLLMQQAPMFQNKLWKIPEHHGPCDTYLCVGSSKHGRLCPMGPIHDCFGCMIEVEKFTKGVANTVIGAAQPFTKEFFEKVMEKYK
jgi:hypothetical protein